MLASYGQWFCCNTVNFWLTYGIFRDNEWMSRCLLLAISVWRTEPHVYYTPCTNAHLRLIDGLAQCWLRGDVTGRGHRMMDAWAPAHQPISTVASSTSSLHRHRHHQHQQHHHRINRLATQHRTLMHWRIQHDSEISRAQLTDSHLLVAITLWYDKQPTCVTA